MADPGTLDDAKLSGLQLIVKAMSKLLSPLSDVTKKDLRDEYFNSLGIDGKDFEAGKTDKVDSFLAKKAEEADILSFAAAMKEQTDIVTNIADIFERNIPFFSGQPFEKKRLVNDLTTSLLNILTLEYVRTNAPTLHNILMMLYSLNNFSNRGTGAYSIPGMVGDYAKRWAKSFNLETADEARRLSEVFFVAGTLMAYLANRSLSDQVSHEDIETTLLVGGQFGNEANRIDKPSTPKEFISDLLGRSFELSVSMEKGDEKNEMSAAFVMLSKDDVSSGVEVFFKDKFSYENIRLSDNWFLSFAADGSINFVAGGNSTDSDVDVSRSKFSIAFERLVYPKGTIAEETKTKHFTDYFRLGIGNLSFQLEAEPKDIAFTFVVQLIYLITNSKINDAGVKEKGGFPMSLLPERSNIVDIPLRYSLKNNFGFDGGFIGERPAGAPEATARRSLTTTPGSMARTAEAPAPAGGKNGTFTIPIHKELGPVRFDKVHIDFDTDKGLGLNITLDFTLKLGSAIVISISKLGTSLSARKRTTDPVDGGFLGYDIVPAFVPPSGAGIVIDAGAVKGGGFLYFDDKKGEYYGAIELDVKGLFSLNAIGIIRTRDDNGRNLFSLIILVTAEFKPVQLGFGFTLNGVGGLLALNRTANVQYLQEGLTNNVLDNILFPKDVVANMNRIISGLTTAFPIKDNHLVIGLMAKIGWGTPSKITADIGIILDFPDTRIILVGVVRANFPSEKKAILKLKASILGVLDFKNQFIYFRADLSDDSRILTFRLTGSWVLGICWGDPNVFVLSAGGFNPRFKEIPKLPTLPNAFANMQRIGIQLLDTDNPRILVEAYFAVTSNTVQFGGKAEFLYDVFWDYNVYGKIEVHALFQFNPFHFIFDIDVQIGLRDRTDWVMGILINGTLEGPTPWHLKATAVAKMPWWCPDIEVELEMTWGNTVPAVPPPIIQLYDQVRDAVLDTRNWSASLPVGSFTHVTFRQPVTDPAASGADTPGLLRLAPNGILKFSQSIVPLDFTLQKFGEQVPDVSKFSIIPMTIGNSNATGNEVRDLFSSDMFIRMNTDERLSRPSFERMKSGFEITETTNALQIGPAEVIGVSGEISEVSSKEFDEKKSAVKPVNMRKSFGRIVRNSSSAYKSAASLDNKIRKGGYGKLTPVKEQYVVATKEDLKNHFVNRTFGSFAEAEEERRKQPALIQKRLRVVDNFELV